MRDPTPVTTRAITAESRSSVNDMPTGTPPIRIQSPRDAASVSPPLTARKPRTARTKASAGPAQASGPTSRRGMRRPPSPRRRKPAKQRSGMPKSVSVGLIGSSSSPREPADLAGVRGAPAPVGGEEDREAHGGLRGRHREHHDHEDLRQAGGAG